ncbi:MAG: metallophosphatase family protein [Thaumarchaeota archaeon]|nr:metallophosphatase family protein [Nitrososphaerota archaeon]
MIKTGGVAFISDVHSNVEALRAVLSDFGSGPVYCLGDIVGYGASPNEVVELLQDRKATCIIGNHDRAVLTGDVGGFNARAGMAAHWTMDHITEPSRAFLAGLPTTRTEKVFDRKVYMVHGSPDDHLWEYVYEATHRDLFGHYLTKLKVDVLATGHTHMPFVWTGPEGMAFNPGSVGQPRTSDKRASYAIVRGAPVGVAVELRGVNYDVEASAKKIIRAGLPESLATRLFSGE